MNAFFKTLGVFAAVAMMSTTAFAANQIAAGKIKSIESDKKEFVLIDVNGKEAKYKLGDAVVINRGGVESQNDLKPGDPVNVCYEKGTFTWTAHYILVQEGDTKDSTLVDGTVKSYDAATKNVTFTDHQDKDWVFPIANVKFFLNKESSKIADIKIGDSGLAVVQKDGESYSLRRLMIARAK
jgi:Cu/Ag efflux protein CusF